VRSYRLNFSRESSAASARHDRNRSDHSYKYSCQLPRIFRTQSTVRTYRYTSSSTSAGLLGLSLQRVVHEMEGNAPSIIKTPTEPIIITTQTTLSTDRDLRFRCPSIKNVSVFRRLSSLLPSVKSPELPSPARSMTFRVLSRRTLETSDSLSQLEILLKGDIETPQTIKCQRKDGV
jgi:hypothetical protein